MDGSTTLHDRRWWALGLLAAAQFMVIMDTSIIGVALPDIQAALGFSQSGLSWVFNAYVVAFGGLLLLGGRLSDLLGPRRVFIAGWAILTRCVGARRRSPTTAERRDRRARPPGRRRGAHRTVGADAPDDALRRRAARARQGLRDLRRRRAGRRHRRRVPRRRAHRVGRLALGLPRQHPGRRSPSCALSPRLLPAGRPGAAASTSLGASPITGALSLTVLGIVRAPEEGWTSAETLVSLGARPGLLARLRRRSRRSRRDAADAARRSSASPNLAAANVVDGAARRRLDPDVVLPQPLPAAGARLRRLREPARRCCR